MAFFPFLIAFILIAKASCAMPSPTQPSRSQAMTLTAEPTTIHNSFTPELTVNCSIIPSVSNMSVLLSIALAKTYPEEHHQNFNEIAIVASLSSPHLQVKDALDADVSAQILVDKPSYLIYKWKYPSQKATGRYMCTAHGMDKTGHPVKFITEAEVIEKEVDIQMVLEKMRLMEINQEVLVSRLNETTVQLNHTKINQEVLVSRLNETTMQLNHTEKNQEMLVSRLNDMETNQDNLVSLLNETKVQLEMEIKNCNCNKTMVKLNQTSSELATLSMEQTKAQTEIDNLQTQLNNSQLDLKDASFSYNGHKYIVSRQFYRNIDVAQAICALFGGYLVEINDENEYQFMNNTLRDMNIIDDMFLIGITDKGHEGTWTYLKYPTDKTDATFFKWASNEPGSGEAANCAGLMTDFDYFMVDAYCYYHTFDRCICEIE